MLSNVNVFDSFAFKPKKGKGKKNTAKCSFEQFLCHLSFLFHLMLNQAEIHGQLICREKNLRKYPYQDQKFDLFRPKETVLSTGMIKQALCDFNDKLALFSFFSRVEVVLFFFFLYQNAHFHLDNL